MQGKALTRFRHSFTHSPAAKNDECFLGGRRGGCGSVVPKNWELFKMSIPTDDRHIWRVPLKCANVIAFFGFRSFLFVALPLHGDDSFSSSLRNSQLNCQSSAPNLRRKGRSCYSQGCLIDGTVRPESC